jgi:hypothetical protein
MDSGLEVKGKDGESNDEVRTQNAEVKPKPVLLFVHRSSFIVHPSP